MRKVLFLLVAMALVASGCGGDGDDSEAAQALSDAIRDELLADNDPSSPFGEEEATCVGDKAVEEFGVDGLVSLGITIDDANAESAFETATDDERAKLVDVTLDCIDLRQLFIDEITADSDISPDSAECLGDKLGSREFLEPFVAASLSGDDSALDNDVELQEFTFSAITSCLSFAELEQLGG